MSVFRIRRSAVLKAFAERYKGEANDFEQAWAEFKAAKGDAADPMNFPRFCAQSPQGSVARRWYIKRVAPQ